MKWRSDGGALAALVISPRPQLLQTLNENARMGIKFWSATTRASIGEYTAPAGIGIMEFHWEGTAGGVTIQSGREFNDIKLVRVQSNGKSLVLNLPPMRSFPPRITTSRTGQGILLTTSEPGTRTHQVAKPRVYFYPPNQADPVEIALPGDVGAVRVSDDMVIHHYQNRGEPVTLRFNAATMRLEPFSAPQATSSTFNAVNGEGLVALSEIKKSAAVESWWVVSDPKAKYPAALLAPKATMAFVAESSKNIAYLDADNLFVRRLVPVTQEQVDDLLECEERMKLLPEVKQVGTSMLIFAADHDDNFPPSKEFRDKVAPYAKNDKLFDGFVYSYSGPRNMSEIENLSKTILGYKEGLFGRAVVYTDSSARWESRRKRPPVGGC